MERDSVLFYRSYYEALSELDDADRLACYDAIFAYALDGQEIQAKGVPSMVLKLIKPIIDKNNERYQNGKKGGRPRTSEGSMNNQGETKSKPTDNQTISNSEPYINIKEDIKKDIKDKRFIRPSVDDVRAYCRERGNHVNPESFIAFYDSNGWRVGKNPMKDWKAAVRTWEQRESKTAKPDKWQQQSQRTYDYGALEKQLLGGAP